MQLTSPAFQDGERIPDRFTCQGEDLSPPLHIADVPSAASSLALIMDDADAPSGTFVHWLIWNMPARMEQIPEGLPLGAMVNGLAPAEQAKNDFGVQGYSGPCPPPGSEHRYRFRLYALRGTLSLDPSADRARLEQMMEGQILAETELTGTYSR